MKYEVSNIAAKLISTDDEDVTVAIKATVKNNSDDESVIIEMQGVDADGFEIETVFLRDRFKTPLKGSILAKSVLTEPLQVPPKNPERKVSDEYALSICDRCNRHTMAAFVSPVTGWALASGRPGAAAL